MTIVDWFKKDRGVGPAPTFMGATREQMQQDSGEARYRTDKCLECGCAYFSAGGPVYTVESNGSRSVMNPEGAVLSCLGCGERYYSTADGLRKPAEGALPPAWAMSDLQKRMQSAQDAERSERARLKAEAEKTKPGKRPTQFRTPPKPE